MERQFWRALVTAALSALLVVPWAHARETPVADPAAVTDSDGGRVARRFGDFRLPKSLPPVPSDEGVPPGFATLSVVDLEQMALHNNPTLAQAARRVEALEGKHLQVGLYPNPVVGYVGEEIGDEGRAGQQGMFFGQQLVTAGKLRLDRAVVSHEITQAHQEAEIQRRRVLNDVRAAAYETLAAQRTVALSDELVRIGEEGKDLAQELLKAQEVSRVDVLQARVEANSAKLLRDNARNARQAAWRGLAIVVGVPDMEPAALRDELSDEPPLLTWVDSRARLLGASPELARAYAQIERAQCALARECAGRVPNVNVETGVRYDFATDDTVAGVAVALPLQLFDRNQGNICRAQAELAAARREVRRVELALQQRLATAFEQYSNSRQQVQRYKMDILPDAQDSLRLVQQGYRQDEFGYLELITAQRTYFRVNLAYVQALRDLWVSSTQIEGLLLSGGLERVGE